MKKRIHAVAGILAMALVTTFMVSTVIVEVVGDESAVLAVKTAILFALALLIPSVAVAGATGRSLAAGRNAPLLNNKKRRTAIIAAIGLVILVPCAVTLRNLAAAGDLGTTFAIVQAVEIAGGLVNLTLLALNARAGRLLTAARRRRKASAVGA